MLGPLHANIFTITHHHRMFNAWKSTDSIFKLCEAKNQYTQPEVLKITTQTKQALL